MLKIRDYVREAWARDVECRHWGVDTLFWSVHFAFPWLGLVSRKHFIHRPIKVSEIHLDRSGSSQHDEAIEFSKFLDLQSDKGRLYIACRVSEEVDNLRRDVALKLVDSFIITFMKLHYRDRVRFLENWHEVFFITEVEAERSDVIGRIYFNHSPEFLRKIPRDARARERAKARRARRAEREKIRREKQELKKSEKPLSRMEKIGLRQVRWVIFTAILALLGLVITIAMNWESLKEWSHWLQRN